jgi:hypothetical protein
MKKEMKEFVKIQELDMEGRYVVQTYGTYITNEKAFGQHPILENLLTITDEGYEWIENELNIKHPGRGWVTFKFIDRDEVEKELNENQKLVQHMVDANIELANILK